MRIIAGLHKGRRLLGPKGPELRPTSDSLRETLFNVLGPSVVGQRFLDGFAGTGAVGLEALSRGAVHVTFVERDRHALKILEQNVHALGAEDACAIIRDDFVGGRFDRSQLFDIVLIDPPYDIPDLGAAARAGAGLVAPAGRLVVEHGSRRESPESAGNLQRARVLIAGDSALSFYT